MAQIYKDHKAIFIGHTKCAESSLYIFLGCHWAGPGIFGEADPPKFPQHNSQLVSQCRKVYPNYKIFSFIRNPFDRILSCYFYYCQNDKTRGFANLYRTFNDWVLAKKRGEKYGGGFVQRLSDRLDGELDFTGHFETLYEDVEKVKEMFDIKTPEKFPWINRSNRRPKESRKGKGYRDFYTEESRKFVEKYYQNDLKNFGYEF